MIEVKTVYEACCGIMFTCLSAKTGDKVEVYSSQKAVDGKVSYGRVFRNDGVSEIYNPDFEIMANA